MYISVVHTDSLPGVQQANNHILERDIVHFTSVQAWVLSVTHNQAHPSRPSLPLFIHRGLEFVTLQVQPLYYAWLVISMQVT